MSRKIIDVNNPGGITKKQESMLMKAYEDYADSSEIKVPPRDHLGTSRVKGVNCDHKWEQAPLEDAVSKWFQATFEEVCDPGLFCRKCGATALVETEPNYMGEVKRQIWAYDSTTRFFGKVPKERKHASRE